jgi:hypothetical protein
MSNCEKLSTKTHSARTWRECLSGATQLPDPCQVMIVVHGDKEQMVHKTHSHFQVVIVVRGAPLFKTAVQTLASYTREASAARSRCCAESPQTEYVDSGGEKCNPLGTQM